MYSSENRTNPLLPSKSVPDLIIRKHDRPLQECRTADRKTLQANGEDAAFVMIQFVDANGTADLHTKHTLKVELEGAGILEAVGSANPCSEERYDTPESETFDGCCMAVIRAGEAAGEIHLTVTADDSVQKQLTILIQEAEC